MNFIYEHQVCPCGSKSIFQHNQLQVVDVSDIDDGRRWTTLAEREADPSLVVSREQHCVAIGDPTWYTCSACDAWIDPLQAREWYTKMMGGRSWLELPIKEEVGIGVFNPRGLERLKLNRG